MSPSFVSVALSSVLFMAVLANAEQHTIRMVNNCGKGTPTLILGGQIVSTGADYVSNAPISGIAYLQTGDCGFNGENCALLEMTIGNPTVPGGGSSTDISLIPPHAFNVQTSFSYFNGCDGQGADCSSGSCSTAFFQPNDNQVQVQCETDNVDLLIEFCGDATQTVNGGSNTEPASSAAHSSTAASPPPQTHSASPTVHSSVPAPASPSVHTSIAASASPSAHTSSAVAATSAAPVNVGAPPSSAASAPSASASVPNRKSCKSPQRRTVSAPVADADARPRAIYDAHRRHHARAMDDARRRSNF